MSKVSIRFYNDYEVRAVWNEEHSKCIVMLIILSILGNQE